ncbi:AAA family ATPase [Bremerella sp. P1]|uniref:AAA family ATPase n=1 Tax=Bremerella sp. P1 TaxID=3026424 RepID=UPI0023683B76|nr:AAA family ATPase [Bremerella sp. P1]WDI41959.1 AAA family ATPase [Bremerella sp. P1]
MSVVRSPEETAQILELGEKLRESVLDPMKRAFVGKDEIIDLLGICLVARENLFILGPPGTAKSALVQQLARRMEGKVFDYLLTRFSEPNEIFGPFDIRKLRDGELITNTEGMLPEATFVFLDELLNANSAILNSLLLVLNERIFRRGRETRHLPTLMVVGASNCLPQDEALAALFDRFLLRVRSDNVHQEQLASVLSAGWKLDTSQSDLVAEVTVEDIQRLNSLLSQVDLSGVQPVYVDLVHRLRHVGVAVSDRRAVKLQRILAASALLCGRLVVNRTDMWVLRHIWDREEQQDVLSAIIDDVLREATEEEVATSHPRSQDNDTPDAERLAAELDRISERIETGELPKTDRAYVRDQLGLLAARCQWVRDSQQRTHLETTVNQLLERLGADS